MLTRLHKTLRPLERVPLLCLVAPGRTQANPCERGLVLGVVVKYSEMAQGHLLFALFGTGGHPPSCQGITQFGKQPPCHGSGRLLLDIDLSGQLHRFHPSCLTIREVEQSHQHPSGPVCGLGVQADNRGIECRCPTYVVIS